MTALPDSMRFTGPLPAVTDLRSYTVESQSLSLSYSIGASSSDTVQITIPAIANGFLDPATLYLHGTFTNTSTHATAGNCAVRFSGSAQSLIQRHDLYSGQSSSALLQSLDNYNFLAQELLDLEGPAFQTGQFSMLGGISNSAKIGSITTGVLGGPLGNLISAPAHGLLARHGRQIAAAGGGGPQTWATQTGCNFSTEEQGNTFNFAIPVLSPLGIFGTKAVPLAVGFTNFFYLATGTVALQVPPTNALVLGGTPQGTLTNLRLVYRVIETPPPLTAALFASTGGGPLQIPVTNWVSSTGTHPALQSTNSILLGVAAASAKSILFGFRNSEAISNVNADTIANRINPCLDQWWLQIGSSVLPVNKVRTDAQTFATLLQSRHMLNVKAPIALCANTWTQTSGGTVFSGNSFTANYVGPSGSWMAGYDLDQVTGKTDSVISGLNLNGQIVTVNLQWPTGNVPSAALQFNAHIERNALLSFQPGAGFQVAY